jgi:hypothetical protein
LEECECHLKAKAEYEANKQQCEMLDGDDYEICAKEIRMIYEYAIENCTPKTCEEQYEVDYKRVMEYCLSEGGNQFICEA